MGRHVINLFLAQATEAGGDFIRALNPGSPFVWCVCVCLVCVCLVCVCVCLVCVRQEKGFYILVNQREAYCYFPTYYVVLLGVPV